MNKQIDYDYFFKILLPGHWHAGKSSLQCRFATGSLPEDYLHLIRPDFLNTTLNIDDKKVKLQLWEPVEDGRFRPVPRNHYRGMQGFILIYDISNRESFSNIPSFLKEIDKNGLENAAKILVGNKCDLEHKRKVSYEEGKEYAEKLGIKFMEVSAKDGTNVQNVLDSIVNDLIRKAEGLEESNDEVSVINKSSREKQDNFDILEKVAMAFRSAILLSCLIFIGFLLVPRVFKG